jgi:hypothetical protein
VSAPAPVSHPTRTPSEVREAVLHASPGVAKGPGSVLVLFGSEGSGKTRLLSQIAEDARRNGWNVLTGEGTRERREIPRGLILDALAPLLPAGSGDPEPNTPGFGLGFPLALAALLPAGAPSAPEPPSRREPVSTFDRPNALAPAEGDAHLLRRLTDATAGGPVLLILDDVQWADDLSLGFLRALSRQAGRYHLLLLLALDPDRAPRIAREFAPQAQGGLAQEVWHLAAPAGHPQELPPAPPRVPPGTPQPTETYSDEELLAQAAALGMQFDVPLLMEVTRQPRAKVEAMVERAATRGWIWKEGDEFHFSGERTWRWALGLFPAGPQELHLRAAKALERLHPNPEGRVLFDLARHWQEAGYGPKAFDYLLRSSRAAYRVGAFQAARERLLRAQKLLSLLPVAERGEKEVRVSVELAGVEDLLGHGTVAEDILRHALLRAEEIRVGPLGLARLELRLSSLLRRRGKGVEALGILDRARRRAEEAQEEGLLAVVLSRRGMVLRRQGRDLEAFSDIEGALRRVSERRRTSWSGAPLNNCVGLPRSSPGRKRSSPSSARPPRSCSFSTWKGSSPSTPGTRGTRPRPGAGRGRWPSSSAA